MPSMLSVYFLFSSKLCLLAWHAIHKVNLKSSIENERWQNICSIFHIFIAVQFECKAFCWYYFIKQAKVLILIYHINFCEKWTRFCIFWKFCIMKKKKRFFVNIKQICIIFNHCSHLFFIKQNIRLIQVSNF